MAEKANGKHSPNPQKYAIDYDGTYDTDPALYDQIIRLLKNRGHSVLIVTARYRPEPDSEDFESDLITIEGCSVVYTNMYAKKPFLERHGIHIDIWIDNEPYYIHFGR